MDYVLFCRDSALTIVFLLRTLAINVSIMVLGL